MEVGKKILLLRKARGLSQEELAELTQVSRQTVCNWEKGDVDIGINQLSKLCEVLQVNMSYFFDDSAEVAKDQNVPKKRSKTLIVVLSVVAALMAIFSIILAILVFSADTGGFETIYVNVFPNIYLLLFMITFGILIALVIILVVYILKTKKR